MNMQVNSLCEMVKEVGVQKNNRFFFLCETCGGMASSSWSCSNAFNYFQSTTSKVQMLST